MSERVAYESRMEAILCEWAGKVEPLRERAGLILPEKRSFYEEQLSLMRTKYDEALRRFSEFKRADDAGWMEARRNVDKAWLETRNAYARAFMQFEGMHP